MKPSARLRVWFLVALASSGLVARHSHAGDNALAETLFQEGKALMREGNFEAACPKLAESFQQDPASGTLLALAVCRERKGELASAWATYTEVAGRSHDEGKKDREAAAREKAVSLETRLSWLELVVPPAVAALPNLELKRNGQSVPRAAWGSVLPVDPGEQLIEVRASGKRPFSTRIDLTASQRESFAVPALEDQPSGPTRAARKPAAPVTTPEVAPRESAWPVIGLAAAGAGVVALGTGGLFALRAKSLNDDANTNGHCDATGCDDAGFDLRSRARNAGNISTSLFVAGGALLAGGVTVFLVSSRHDESAATRVSAGVTPNGCGVTLTGSL